MSKIDDLRAYISLHNPDIIALNKIKPKNGNPPDQKMMNIPGYTVHTSNLDEPNTRGTCIYVKDEIKSVPITIDGHRFKDCNTVKITQSDNTSNTSILIQCIYRSGTPATAALNDEEMLKLMTETSRAPNYKRKITVGDFNLNKITWNPDPQLPDNTAETSPEARFVECFRDSFQSQHITEPTRYREGNTPTCHDLLITSTETDVTDIQYLPPIGASDHVTLQCTIKADEPTTPATRVVKLYDKTDFTKLREMLNLDWDKTLENLDPQEAMDKFEEVYNNAIDQCVPTKVIDGSKNNKPLWMTWKSLRSVHKKYSAWIRFLNTKQSEDYKAYIKQRNEANHALQGDYALSYPCCADKLWRGVTSCVYNTHVY